MDREDIYPTGDALLRLSQSEQLWQSKLGPVLEGMCMYGNAS